MCILVVLIGRLGRRGTGLVGMQNEVPAAVEHKFEPTAMQCEAPPKMLEEDRLARPVVNNKKKRDAHRRVERQLGR